MKIKFIILLLLLLSFKNSFSQNCNTDSIFHLYKNNIVTLQTHYEYLSLDVETKILFYQLLYCCQNEELQKFLLDDNPYIRTTLFYALVEKGLSYDQQIHLLKRFENDTATFKTKGGCIVRERTVIEEMKLIHNAYLADGITPKDYLVFIQELENNRPVKVQLDGLRQNTIPKEKLAEANELKLSNDSLKVVSFSFIYDNQEFLSSDGIFTEEMKQVIIEMPSGEKVYINNIKVRNGWDEIRYIPGVILIIL